MAIIIPQILKGTRDFLPEEMAKRDYVLNKIKNVFTRFGYDTIDTPAIEYAETLLGKYGEENSMLIYRFPDNGGRDIALRYDQTVPFARVVAQYYNDLPMPFKRYQISKVWRADKPAKGRYREFTQCDIDIVGTTNLLAETEIAKIITVVFQQLGFKRFIIKMNSRRLINSIMQSLNITAGQVAPLLRALDKLDKVGEAAVQIEMEKTIGPALAKKLLTTMRVKGTNAERLAALAPYETGEVRMLLELCAAWGIDENFIEIDPRLARGLDYYTGVIYEVFIPDAAVGAVCAGGRYDNLCALFSAKNLSGVGVAFGFDRIMLAMDMLENLKNIGLSSKVLVTYFNEATLSLSLQVINQLQKSGVNAEIYFEPAKLEKQLKYANKKKIPFIIICGEEEAANNAVTIKNMETGKQKMISITQVNGYFNGYINL